MNNRSSIVKKYAETETKIFMTLAEAEALAIELAMRIRKKVAQDLSDNQLIVVGIANGGLMVAKIVSETLGAPLETMRIRRSGTTVKRKIGRYGWVVSLSETLLRIQLIKNVWRRINNKMKRLEIETVGQLSTEYEQKQVSLKGKQVILIDDCIQSGETVQLAQKTLLEAGAKLMITGVLTRRQLKEDLSNSKQLDPILYLNTKIQHYPWSQNNKEYENFLYWLNERGIKPWK